MSITSLNPIFNTKVFQSSPNKTEPTVPEQSLSPAPLSKISFTSNPQTSTIRTELSGKDEAKKYNEIASLLDKPAKKILETLLKNGKLLNNNSNDKSTVLDNLHKMAQTPRAQGLDIQMVLSETINTIANPHIITQQFGDIPQQHVNEVLEFNKQNTSATSNLIQKASENLVQNTEVNEKTINVLNSGSCVAASIEFNLAAKLPAEFARIAEGLTSPNVASTKIIETKNLANNALDAIWLLNAFEIPYEMADFNKAKVTLAPDKNAILRAQIQNSHKDPTERSLVDVLMQSTFMNIGSQNTYNSLTDTRKGKFNQNDKGLIEFEKTFTESVVEDKNKISVTYQIIDDDEKLIGYEADFNTMKRHILDTLKMNENVIIGYTQVDGSNKIINGHEITIIGTETDKNGKLVFVCNDTDDDKSAPIRYSEDYLLPKIHHAGLPQSVVEKDVTFVDNWVEGLKSYKEMKAPETCASDHSF